MKQAKKSGMPNPLIGKKTRLTPPLPSLKRITAGDHNDSARMPAWRFRSPRSIALDFALSDRRATRGRLTEIYGV